MLAELKDLAMECGDVFESMRTDGSVQTANNAGEKRKRDEFDELDGKLGRISRASKRLKELSKETSNWKA